MDWGIGPRKPTQIARKVKAPTGRNSAKGRVYARMLQITENAGKLIKKMTDRNGIPDGGLRIGIKAGGCSGLSYTFAWEPAPKDGDHVFDGPEGSKVFIDPRSFRFLDGTTLDYDTSLVSKGFVFSNPHAKSSCGCGTSFSV